MSSKKRKGDLPESATAETAQAASHHVNQLSQLKAGIDAIGASGDDDEDHATTRIKLDEAQAKLAAALLEIERLRATASEPCPRCHFYSDWTVRVRTMGGHVYTIACPDGPKTLVAQVKQKLAQFDPKCHILQQLALVLPCEASCSSSSADLPDPALADDRTLASYGVSKRDALDLFLVDIIWSDACQQIIDQLKTCRERAFLISFIGDELPLAVSWALVNSVCSLQLFILQDICRLWGIVQPLSSCENVCSISTIASVLFRICVPHDHTDKHFFVVSYPLFGIDLCRRRFQDLCRALCSVHC